MWEQLTMENTLFAQSLSKCQTLINTMLEYKNKDGVCMVSQTELAKRLSLSQSNIGNAIKKINVEDLCVEMICPGMYVIHYSQPCKVVLIKGRSSFAICKRSISK